MAVTQSMQRRGSFQSDRSNAPPPESVPVVPLRASDYLLLMGIATLPLLDPIPGAFDKRPDSAGERLGICDVFFVMAMVVELCHWLPALFRGQARTISRGKSACESIPGLPFPTSPIWFGAAALMISIVLSWCANPRQAITSHMAIAALAQLYLLGIAVLIAAAICRWRSLKPIVLAWLAGFALEAAICIFDSLAMLTGRSMLYPSVAHRIRGTFRTSAQLASFSLMSFFVILAGSRLLAREKSLKMASYLLAGLAPLFIVLASRRSTLASLAVGFVVLLIISRHRVRIFLSTVVPVGVAIVTLYFFVPPEIHAYFTRRIEPLLGEDPHRVGVAIDHFRRGVEAFQEHPVLGVGFGAFKETRFGFWEENVEVVDEGKSMTHEQHSGYVAILAETGTIGFASMMFIHLAVLWVILGVWLRGPYPLSGLAADFLVLFAALATSEIYNRIWRERSLWVVLGIVAVLPTLVAFSRPQLRNAGSRLQAVGRSAWGGMVRRPGSYQSGTSL